MIESRFVISICSPSLFLDIYKGPIVACHCLCLPRSEQRVRYISWCYRDLRTSIQFVLIIVGLLFSIPALGYISGGLIGVCPFPGLMNKVQAQFQSVPQLVQLDSWAQVQHRYVHVALLFRLEIFSLFFFLPQSACEIGMLIVLLLQQLITFFFLEW